MALKASFTKAGIESLPTTGKQYSLHDVQSPGLQVMVSPGGTKTFMLNKKVNRKNFRLKIGRVSDVSIENARKQADILRSQLTTGELLHRVLQPKASRLTFKTLYLRYYDEHAVPHTKRPRDNWLHIHKHIIPRIGAIPVAEITKKQMKDVHRKVAESSGEGQANRMLDLASAVFNYGLLEEIYDGRNPCLGIKRFKRNSKDRFLSKTELKAFFNALDDEDEIFRDFFLLSLFIGARKSTMLAMKYSEIDFENRSWRLSEKLTKNGDTNYHVLSDHALKILNRRKISNSDGLQSEYVFPGDGESGHLVDPKKSFNRVKQRMGIADFTIHDLRRTLASYMAINGTSLPIIGRALNHKSLSSTEIYARLSQDAVLSALNSATSLIVGDHPKLPYWQESVYYTNPVSVKMIALSPKYQAIRESPSSPELFSQYVAEPAPVSIHR